MPTSHCGRFAAALAFAVLPAHAVAQAALLAERDPGYQDFQRIGETRLVDFDADGDLDLWIGERVFRNDGDGRLLFNEVTDSVLPPGHDPFGLEPLVFLDLEGDGDLDVLFERGEFYRNDGNGAFATTPPATWLPAPGVFVTHRFVVLDADGDGDDDVFLYRRAGQNALFLNDGTGSFVDVTATHLPTAQDSSEDAAAADVDGDGDVDLYVSNNFIADALLLNDGSGVFTPALPAATPPVDPLGFDVAFGDVDGDGDADLLLQGGPLFAQAERLWINDGAGAFTDQTAARIPTAGNTSGDAHFADVDGDGDLDMFSGVLRLNDGLGNFGSAIGSSFDRRVATGDVDLDGDLDVFDGIRILAGDGTGAFESRLVGDWLTDEWVLRFEDVAGDPRPDVVIEAHGAVIRDLRLRTRGLRPVDLNGDGVVDLLGDEAAAITVYTGNGTGTFVATSTATVPAGIPFDRRLATGDVDGDGDVDVVVAAAVDPNGAIGTTQTTLLLNDGAGQLAAAPPGFMPTDAGLVTGAVDLGDIDGDGDLDLALATGRPFEGMVSLNQPDRIYVNDGSGVFVDESAARLPGAPFERTGSVRFGDVDLDGDLDLVTGTSELFVPHDRLYLNDGAGFFSAAPAGFLATPVNFVDLADLNGDGRLDLVGRAGAAFGDGAGGFLAAGASAPLDPAATDLHTAVGDWDGDGDVDVVQDFERTEARRRRVFVSTDQHLALLDFARLGRDLRLRVHAQSASVGLPLAVPLLAFGTASVETPFGAFGLDAGSLVTLPVLTLPNGRGSTDLVLTLPVDPGIVDFRVFYQAIVLDGIVASPRLTNVFADQILGG